MTEILFCTKGSEEELKKLLEDIDNVKPKIDIFDMIVDEQIKLSEI